ncbi:MAG: hypothetical protein CMJ18_05770 [Phycisphaeraceae bacterium]|nr:hypothetical protein [Phycisphaeraceae bacterium]
MADNIQIGTRVQVTVVKRPTNQAAAKTIARVLSKDETVAAELKRHEKVRRANFRTTPRGGRQFALQLQRKSPVRGAIGETGTVFASADVINDLNSVSRFVEIRKADR